MQMVARPSGFLNSVQESFAFCPNKHSPLQLLAPSYEIPPTETVLPENIDTGNCEPLGGGGGNAPRTQCHSRTSTRNPGPMCCKRFLERWCPPGPTPILPLWVVIVESKWPANLCKRNRQFPHLRKQHLTEMSYTESKIKYPNFSGLAYACLSPEY